MREARHYTGETDGTVRCALCPHRCRIRPGETGLCRARRNRDGMLTAESYGRVSALALDPVEKKPLRRFRPGGMVLSAGSYGCNLRCPFCQNYGISMERPETRFLSPEALAARALELADRGNIGAAFTYNEPLVGYEYVLDAAKRLKESGQSVVMVTNGFVEEEPLKELLPWVDAWNIDLKSFREAGYRALGGKLAPVLRTIRAAAAHSHVEVTALIVPGHNDSLEEMEEMAAWLASVDPGIPLHVSRYFPRYRSDAPATPVETIYRLAEAAGRCLRYVYMGNV